MQIVVDTSIIIAVIIDAPEKQQLIQLTSGARLLAAASLEWEVGNAFSAMFKRKQINLEQALQAIELFQAIGFETIGVELSEALRLAAEFNIYAYDAYVIATALASDAPLMTLDRKLVAVAKQASAQIIEVM